eukprot:CAMPEP_0119277390 /NCGR_PEP_ID=MMETSP1329-20130426/17039_1 /TAXON_ID=114041 /ORGANISM="Genus nov. species nov., Strain RCC1024" /LENGTH=124 /DNA_ID=CAMNT_0007277855 /DNA_START=214 /DNA_END=584 /DNA_ORIENTATION=-
MFAPDSVMARLLLAALVVVSADGLSLGTRRRCLGGLAAAIAAPTAALAKPDCITDCRSNCNRIAKGNEAYCATNCEDYCNQDDRKDGLSGSVSSEGGEVGWSTPMRGGETVPYGKDVPPAVNIL